jgi:hypothetical protein
MSGVAVSFQALPANINVAAAAPARSEPGPAHAGPGDEDKGH